MSSDGDFSIPRHPIGVVAERTGLSPHVLRVWERRYRVVEPSRADGRQRLYSDADVERLRLIRLATLVGRSIGWVARLSTEELSRLVREDEAARRRVGRREDGAVRALAEDDVERALTFARTLDGRGLEVLLRQVAATLGVPAFLDAMATPLLRRMGDEWHAGRLTPAQEHLATAVLERVLNALTQFLLAPQDAPDLLLATLAGEQHRIGATLAAVAAVAQGWQVTYLGAGLPAGEIASAAAVAGARVVGVSVVYLADRERVLGELRTLRARLPASVPLLVGGAGAAALAPELRGAGIWVAEDLTALRDALRKQSEPDAEHATA